MLAWLGEQAAEHVGGHGLIGTVGLPLVGIAAHARRQAAIRTANAAQRQ